ncbi:MAG: PQQ-like beta-propeller repeat protein [Pirellulaceae bacterium]|nr:PQQ-like beta-propeller repeat protein [Pirellulaceae bacterium]
MNAKSTRIRTAMLLAAPLVLVAVAGWWGTGRPATADAARTPADLAAATSGGRESTAAETAEAADTAADSTGWPNLFGPRHNSVSAETGIRTLWPAEGPPVLWERPVGTGYNSPIAQDDQLILLHRQGDEEHLECFHVETGQTLWRTSYPTSYQNKYHYSHGPYSTPALDDERIYAVSAEGCLHCVRRDDGRIEWRRPLYEEYGVKLGAFAVAASPLVDGPRLIFNLGAGDRGAGIIALDKLTGQTLWTATDHAASCATPCAATLHGRRLVFVVTYEGLVALESETGRVLWQIEHRPKAPDSINATSPLVVGDRVVMVSGPGPGALVVRVLADGQYEELWRDRRVLDSQFNNLVCVGDHLYGFSSKRQDGATFRCVELDTGRLRWHWVSDLARGCVLAVDGHFLLWGEHGHLAALEIDTTRPLVRSLTTSPLLETPCYSAPALHRGLLFVRNEQKLVCLNLRRETAELTSYGAEPRE